MKRILCALVALFTVIGFHASAQINVNIASNNGEIGDVVSVPITIQLPVGSQLVDYCQGGFITSNSSIAKIVDVSSNFATTSVVGSTANFSCTNEQAGIFQQVFLTLEVKIYGLGCVSIIPTNSNDPLASFEFEVDGTLFSNLGSDFNFTQGQQVCGIQSCNCDMSNVQMGPFTITPAAGDCNIHTIAMDPVDPCPNTEFSHSYYWEIYNSTGGLVHTHTGSNFTQNAFYPPGIYTIVVHFTLEDNTGCVKTVSYSEDFDFSGCGGCSCNPYDLVLGDITMIQSTSDCSSYVINVPPVDGCSSVEESRNYNFKIYNSAGVLIHEVDENLDGTLFDFYTYPPGTYTIQVTYSMIDDSGCEHTLPKGTFDFNWTGCDCPGLPVPTSLDCDASLGSNGTTQTLSWNPVPGANTYEVEIHFNDPNSPCCAGALGSQTKSILAAGPSGFYTVPSDRCFSWRVRSVCTDGSVSGWSSLECSCETEVVQGPVGPGRQKSADGTNYQAVSEGPLAFLAVPNPANEFVEIALIGWSSEILLNSPEIVIYDMAGKVVYQSEMAINETKTVDVRSFKSGSYLINIVEEGVVLSTEKLIVNN